MLGRDDTFGGDLERPHWDADVWTKTWSVRGFSTDRLTGQRALQAMQTATAKTLRWENERESRSVMSLGSATPWAIHGPWNSPGQNTGRGSLSLLQGIFPTQGSNPGLQHCRQILYRATREAHMRWRDMLINATVVIFSQCTGTSNHHTVHFKCVKILSIISHYN